MPARTLMLVFNRLIYLRVMNADAPVAIVNQSGTLPEFAPKYLQGFLELFPNIHRTKIFQVNFRNGYVLYFYGCIIIDAYCIYLATYGM